MKFETILEYLTDKIRSDLNDIISIANHPRVPNDKSQSIKEMINSIRRKLDMINE